MSPAGSNSVANPRRQRAPWSESFEVHPAILMFIINLVVIGLFLISEAAIIAPRPEGDELNGIDEKLMWLATSFPLLILGIVGVSGWIVFLLKKRNRSSLPWSLWAISVLGWMAAVLGYGSFAADMFNFFKMMAKHLFS